MMPEKVFWAIVQACCQHDAHPNEWDQPLIAALRTRPPEEVVGFDYLLEQQMDRAFREELWAAASLMNGGASHDGFTYFRCWLVGMGKRVYESAVSNPDSLIEVARPDEHYEAEIRTVAYRVWSAQGRDFAEFEEILKRLGPEPDRYLVPAGWDPYGDHDEIRRRWPRLAKRYLTEDGP